MRNEKKPSNGFSRISNKSMACAGHSWPEGKKQRAADACLCGDESQKTRHLAVATDVHRPLEASFPLDGTDKGLRNSFSEAFVYNLGLTKSILK